MCAGKKYGLLDFTACLCMSIGLILFTLADSEVQPNFNIYGKSVIRSKEYHFVDGPFIYSLGLALAYPISTPLMLTKFVFCHVDTK